jgi:hypothetical protein
MDHAAAHEVERPMWGPNPEPLRGWVEDRFWWLGTGFLSAYGSAVMGKHLQITKAEGGPPKPPGWGEIMRMFNTPAPPEQKMATWSSLVDGFVNALLPTKTAEDAAKVWALQSSLLSTIEARVKAISSPSAWDQYFHVMPPAQQQITEWTSLRGAQFVTKMTAAARQKTLDVLLEANLANAGPRYIETHLREELGRLNRDWRRIAITETAMSISNGQLASVADSGEWEAVWIAGPRACPFCRKMFGRAFRVVAKPLPGMDPDKFIWPGKHNVGRSAHLYRRDGTKRGPEELWIPCIPAHPNCMCLWSLRRVLTSTAAKNAEKVLAALHKERFDRYAKA